LNYYISNIRKIIIRLKGLKMVKISFDRFYRFEELSEIMRNFENEYPHLVKISSIGKSYEGRDIWLATVTNFESGEDHEKPAFWVDGNIHATEVSGSAACLYHIQKITQLYGNNEQITHVLDTRVFYICPRLNPDGAEWALADQPKFIRSSTRPYPYDDEPSDGLLGGEDIDGDGRILTMRIKDPNGAWKIHPDESRLMVRREPTEYGGTYYRLLPEGRVHDYDGSTIKIIRPKEGLDLNRNYPMEWRSENEQQGAGIYPTSEPEVRAMVDFIATHKNITGALSFHTYSGVLLRPYASRPDDELPTDDLWTYQKIGEKGTTITGYPNISIFHDFKYHPKQVITGGADWIYEHQGMFYWAVEIWSPMRQAGIEDFKYVEWSREHPIEDDLKMLKWNDETLNGKGYVDWYSFNHPELGEVELGGWDTMSCWRNPPPEFIEGEIEPFPDWLIWMLLISPRLSCRKSSVTHLGDNLFKIRVEIENTGWLPTYVTKKALEKKLVRGIIAEIDIPDGTSIANGKTREELGQLEGRAYKTPIGGSDSTDDRMKIEWIIKCEGSAKIEIKIHHERAGFIRLQEIIGE
jgi:murein tripeptide amidase MpaA